MAKDLDRIYKINKKHLVRHSIPVYGLYPVNRVNPV
jgi:hypothetical protein